MKMDIIEDAFRKQEEIETLNTIGQIIVIAALILIALFLLIITINIIIIRHRTKKTINILTYELKSQNILLSEIRDLNKQQYMQQQNWNNQNQNNRR